MKIRDVLTEKRLHNLEAMVSEIDVHELNDKLAAGEILRLIEVSTAEDFARGHIVGAAHVPLDKITAVAATDFRRMQQIIVYAEAANSSVGWRAVRFLQNLGFSNVLLLSGGKAAWREAGLALEGDAGLSGNSATNGTETS